MIQKLIPSLKWIREYHPTQFKDDLLAGLLVSIMLIPQGMAYAMLAGLPPVIGLYASTFPLIAYALFGSSRHLAVGPVAMISLLVFSGVSSVAEPGSERYLELVLLLTFLIGLLQWLMGLLRLGFFINFFSHAVLSGFTSAGAIIIFISQLGHLLGIKVPFQHSIIHFVIEIVPPHRGDPPDDSPARAWRGWGSTLFEVEVSPLSCSLICGNRKHSPRLYFWVGPDRIKSGGPYPQRFSTIFATSFPA